MMNVGHKHGEILFHELSREIENGKTDLDALYDEMSEKYHFQNVDLRFSPVAGFPKDIGATLVHDPVLQMWERHCLYKMIEMTNDHDLFREILTKGIVYREIPLYTVIRAPWVKHQKVKANQFWQYYVVAKKIVTGDGCTAILLCTLNGDRRHHPCILVFSGSQFHLSGFDALSSYINDTLPIVGRRAFDSARLELNQLFSLPSDLDVVVKDQNLTVLGHSMGGALGQLFTLRYHEKFSIELLETYNSPGIGFSDVVIIDPSLIIRIQRTYGDIVHCAGRYHLINNFSTHCTQYITMKIHSSMLKTNVHTYLCHTNPCELKVETIESNMNPVSVLLEFPRIALGILPCITLSIWKPLWRFIVPSRCQIEMTEIITKRLDNGYTILKGTDDIEDEKENFMLEMEDSQLGDISGHDLHELWKLHVRCSKN